MGNLIQPCECRKADRWSQHGAVVAGGMARVLGIQQLKTPHPFTATQSSSSLLFPKDHPLPRGSCLSLLSCTHPYPYPEGCVLHLAGVGQSPQPEQLRMPQSLLGRTTALRVGTRGPPLCPRLQPAHLPAFFTKPRSASSTSHSSQRKQPGCQLAFMALITRPMTNSPGRGETSAVRARSPHFSSHGLCTQCSSGPPLSKHPSFRGLKTMLRKPGKVPKLRNSSTSYYPTCPRPACYVLSPALTTESAAWSK